MYRSAITAALVAGMALSVSPALAEPVTITVSPTGLDGLAGVPGGFVWTHPDSKSAMSGDGLVVFVRTSVGLVAVTWSP